LLGAKTGDRRRPVDVVKLEALRVDAAIGGCTESELNMLWGAINALNTNVSA
jgi:hypothetical protein